MNIEVLDAKLSENTLKMRQNSLKIRRKWSVLTGNTPPASKVFNNFFPVDVTHFYIFIYFSSYPKYRVLVIIPPPPPHLTLSPLSLLHSAPAPTMIHRHQIHRHQIHRHQIHRRTDIKHKQNTNDKPLPISTTARFLHDLIHNALCMDMRRSTLVCNKSLKICKM